MKQKVIAALLVMTCCTGAPSVVANNRAEGVSDGAKVAKMSPLRTLVPAEQVEALALEQYTDLKQQASKQRVLAPDAHPQVQRLRRVLKRIIPQAIRWNARAAQWQWEVNLIAAKDVNAFCMPGGKIAVFSGLLSELKLTDDELAIVLGHEIAHALREHGRERMAEGLNLGASLGTVVLAFEDTGQTMVGQRAKRVLLKFSGSDETEADLVGLDIAARAGYDPRAAIALWQKMVIVSRNAPPQWLATHPAGTNRIAEIRKHLPEVLPLYAKEKGTATAALPPYQTNVRSISPIT